MSNSPLVDLMQTDWEYDSETGKVSENASEKEMGDTDICGVYELVVVNDDTMLSTNSQTSVNGGGDDSQPQNEEIISEYAETEAERPVTYENCSSVESSEKELSKPVKSKPGRKKKRKIIRKRPCKTAEETAQNNIPSVYSCAEIKRHKKRLKLKAMAESSDTDSDATVNENCIDPDLDINLRIFEESTKSIENVVIGEIHCDVLKDKCDTEENVETNKNANVFKLSVNAMFSEENKEDDCSIGNFDDIGDLEGLSDEYFFSDNDSDLEILTSKPIVR